ncbi:MAG: tetratricopeptide repeat protein [bacterium]
MELLIKNRNALIVMALAIIIRIIYLIEMSHNPGFTVPMVDEKWHWLWANEIIEKSFWGEGAYFRAPFYPYFLAFLSFITNSSIFWAKFLQLLICGGTAYFIYKLAEHLFDYKVGILAGFIYAIYGTFLYYEAMFLIPVVFVFLLVWGMYRLIAYKDSLSFKSWLLTGIIFGLAAISRPNILLVMPFLALWLFFYSDKTSSLINRLKKPTIVFIGVVLMILPVTIRNIIVTDDFSLISTQGGVNFYIGNNPVADGLTMKMPEVDMNESMSWDQFIPATIAAAQREKGRSLTEAEASSFWTAKAVDFILNNPGKFIELTWQKFVYLISGFENSDNSDIYYERGKSTLYSVLLWNYGLRFPFGLLFPLFILGIYFTRSDFKNLLPLYIFILAYIPTIVLFLVTARHRLPLIPVLIIIAAAGIIKAIDLIRQKNWRYLLIGGIILLLSLVLLNREYYLEGGSNQFQIHFNAGIKADHLGNYAESEKEYLKADEFFPYSASLITNLGYSQYMQGKYSDAETNYKRALKIDPEFYSAYNNLGLILTEKNLNDSAIILFNQSLKYFDYELTDKSKLGLIYLNLADAYEKTKQYELAGQAFNDAITNAPQMVEAYFKGAAFYARMGLFEYTDTLYAKGRRLGDLKASDYYNWGLSYIQRQDYLNAIYALKRAVFIDPAFYQAYYLMALSHFNTDSPLDTVDYYIERCLKFNSQYQPAIDFKNQLNQQ